MKKTKRINLKKKRRGWLELKIPPLEAEGHLYRWVSKYWEINFPTQY